MPEVIITFVDASGLRETELLGTQDPFVVVRSDNDTKQTRVHTNGGKNPSGLLFVSVIGRMGR